MKKKCVCPQLNKADLDSCILGKILVSERMVSKIYRDILKKHKITMSQLGLIMIIGKLKCVPQSQLAEMMKLDKSTITRDLKRLIEKNYFVKKGHAKKWMITITETGEKYAETIVPDWNKATKIVTKKLGEDGQKALDLVFMKLSE